MAAIRSANGDIKLLTAGATVCKRYDFSGFLTEGKYFKNEQN